MRKLVKLLYIFTSATRTRDLFFTHVHIVDLLSYLLSRSLFNPSEDGATPFGVTKVLTMEDLKLPILLDKSEDGDRFEG
jgi:hypothetical protein